MVCGGLRWFVVVCGGLWWIAVVCLLVIPSWIKDIDNILKERGTNRKEVEDRGLHLNNIAW